MFQKAKKHNQISIISSTKKKNSLQTGQAYLIVPQFVRIKRQWSSTCSSRRIPSVMASSVSSLLKAMKYGKNYVAISII